MHTEQAKKKVSTTLAAVKLIATVSGTGKEY
jgi:hypothetical protein